MPPWRDFYIMTVAATKKTRIVFLALTHTDFKFQYEVEQINIVGAKLNHS